MKRRFYKKNPSKREVKAALDFYEIMFRKDFEVMGLGEPNTCWAVDAKDQTNSQICQRRPGIFYTVSGRLSNGVQGTKMQCWMCTHHASLMKRRGYTVTPVILCDPDTAA